MEMTMRWFGKDYDTVTLEQIKQTRYATGIITTLYNKMPGEVWNLDEILAMKKEVEDAGLHLAGIESVNVSDAIKTGGAGRDHDIQAYIETLENLGKADIHMVCYNFMPVFDWTRTELDRVREDGSTVMAYNQDAIDKMDPEKMFDAIKDDMNGTVMPGWEPERQPLRCTAVSSCCWGQCAERSCVPFLPPKSGENHLDFFKDLSQMTKSLAIGA